MYIVDKTHLNLLVQGRSEVVVLAGPWEETRKLNDSTTSSLSFGFAFE